MLEDRVGLKSQHVRISMRQMATMANLAGDAAAQGQNVTKVQFVCTGIATPYCGQQVAAGGRQPSACQKQPPLDLLFDYFRTELWYCLN